MSIKKNQKSQLRSQLFIFFSKRFARRFGMLLHQHGMDADSRIRCIAKFVNTQHQNTPNPLHQREQMITLRSDRLQIKLFCFGSHFFLRRKKVREITIAGFRSFDLRFRERKKFFSILLVEKNEVIAQMCQIFFYIFEFVNREIFEASCGFFFEISCDFELSNMGYQLLL